MKMNEQSTEEKVITVSLTPHQIEMLRQVLAEAYCKFNECAVFEDGKDPFYECTVCNSIGDDADFEHSEHCSFEKVTNALRS